MNEKSIEEAGDFNHELETPQKDFKPSKKEKRRHRRLSPKARVALTSSILLTALAGCADANELIQTPSAASTEVPITSIPTATKPPSETKTSTPPPQPTSEAEKPSPTSTPTSTSTPELPLSPTPEIPLGVDPDQYLQYVDDLKKAGIVEKEAIEMAKEKVNDGWFKTKEVEETATPIKEIQPLDWSAGTTPELYQTAGPKVLQTLGIITNQMELRGEKILYYADALTAGKKVIGWHLDYSAKGFYVLLFLTGEEELPSQSEIISVNVEPVANSEDLVYIYLGKGEAEIDERRIIFGLTKAYIDQPKQVIIARRNGQIINSVEIGDDDSILPWQKPTAFEDVVYLRTERSDVDGYIFINQSGEVVKVNQRDNQGNLVFPRSFNENMALLSSHNQDNLAITNTADFKLVDLDSNQVISTNLAQAVDNWIKRHPEKCPKGSFRNYHAFSSENGFLVFFDTSPDAPQVLNLEFPIVGFEVSNTGEVKHAITLDPKGLVEGSDFSELIMLDKAGVTANGNQFAFLSTYYEHGETGITPTLPGLRSSLVKLNLINLETGKIIGIPLNEPSLVEWYYHAMDEYHWDRTGVLDYSGSDTDLARELIVKYGQLNIPQTSEDAFQIRPGKEGNEVWIKLQGGGKIVKPSVLFGEFWSSEDYFPNLERLYSEGQAPDWYRAVRESLPIFYDNLYIKYEIPKKWLVADINTGHKRLEIVQPPS